MKVLERFLSKVLEVESGCHEWQSTLHRDGYGKFYFHGKQVSAHRMSYMLHVGEIPFKKWVLHKCDNRKCVNPLHIYIGDAKQNVKDKIERCTWWGRMKVPFTTVQESIKLYQLGWSQQKIANHLELHQTQISRYINGKQRAIK